MDRLSHVIIFTGDVAGVRRFYESLGLKAGAESPYYVEFDTAAATLGIRMEPDAAKRGVVLQFATDDIEARAGELADRGVACDPIGEFPWGRSTAFADPEENRYTLWEPAERFAAGSGLALSAAINCRDMDAMRRFYLDQLGLAASIDSAWWVGLATGDAGLGLHPRTDRPGAESHHGRAITIGLSVPGLVSWHKQAVGRGVLFTAPPGDRGYGVFADAVDPDGNQVSLRDVPVTVAASLEADETLEEKLAEPFEDDATPQRAAIRKPVRKGAKATSRVATKPAYHSGKRVVKRRRPSKPLEKVASPRGTGPAGTRKKPKRKHDPKRARVKPALGRREKAERRTFKSQKQQVASASKSKPVKRASRPRPAKRTAPKRVAAKSGRR
ncbi:MAG TPA: VOC family protein [Candidatus Eisenbacteria bacterium]|nr:VOC family protein [Candidatus Eisenbacteria bacterium]